MRNLKFFSTHWHQAFPVPSVNLPIPKEVGIHQWAAIISNQHLLPKLFFRKAFHLWYVVLNRGLPDLCFCRITWLGKRSIHIQTPHPPLQTCNEPWYGNCFQERQEVVPMERTQAWIHMPLECLHRQHTKWCIQSIHQFPQPSTSQCTKVYTPWLIRLVLTSRITPFV